MRRLVIALVLTIGVAAAVFFIPMEEAGALPSVETWTFYFSDPNFENEVGLREVRCNGSSNMEGSTGPYSARMYGEACSVPSTPTWCYVCYESSASGVSRVDCDLNEAQFASYEECSLR